MSDTGTDAIWRRWHADDMPVRLGVSSCLLGNEVRYDGGHKHDRYLTDVLASSVEWAPVCPEVEVGMTVPRPTIRLERGGDGDRLVEPISGADFTRQMETFARRRIREMSSEGLDGFILKRGSPSCGMEGVKVWSKGSPVHEGGVGHFARPLLAMSSGLPVEEEGRLHEVPLRHHFIERVFCRNRWRVLKKGGLTRKRLADFHAAHEMLLRAHDPRGCRELGRLVGDASGRSDQEVFAEYEMGFSKALGRKATTREHANVMQHIAGCLEGAVDPEPMRRLLLAIEDYREGTLPLSEPLSLLRHEIETRGIDPVRNQLYLEPYPQALMLRNHA